MKRLLQCLACCCVLLLGGCSLTRLAYDHLATLLRWEAGDYVDFTAQQDRDFDTEIHRVWSWHRRTQLPLYAADFRGLADQVRAGPLSPEQVRAFSDRVDQRWEDLAEAALPGYVRLHAELDDAQVAEMIRRIGQQVEQRRRKRLKMGESGRRDKLADDMDDSLRQWIGRPNARQLGMVRQWAAQVQPGGPREEGRRSANLERYAALLASRNQPGFEQRMRAFIQAPESDPELAAQDLVERDRWLRLLSELSATLEPEQREHLCRRLLDYAEDFETLAAESRAQDSDASS